MTVQSLFLDVYGSAWQCHYSFLKGGGWPEFTLGEGSIHRKMSGELSGGQLSGSRTTAASAPIWCERSFTCCCVTGGCSSSPATWRSYCLHTHNFISPQRQWPRHTNRHIGPTLSGRAGSFRAVISARVFLCDADNVAVSIVSWLSWIYDRLVILVNGEK